METIKVLMDPQPKVRKIDCGWEINGANYFMGFAETHIRKDDRFKPPAENYKDFWIHKDSDGRYNMHRYFPIIDEWTVSVDKQNASLQECLAAVSEAFRKFYPNGH